MVVEKKGEKKVRNWKKIYAREYNCHGINIQTVSRMPTSQQQQQKSTEKLAKD